MPVFSAASQEGVQVFLRKLPGVPQDLTLTAARWMSSFNECNELLEGQGQGQMIMMTENMYDVVIKVESGVTAEFLVMEHAAYDFDVREFVRTVGNSRCREAIVTMWVPAALFFLQPEKNGGATGEIPDFGI